MGEVKSAQFDLYPNPTKDLVHINMSQYYGKDVRIRVVNELGMEMNYREIDELEEAVLEINTRNYAQGLYLVIVQIEDEAPVIKKLVVTK
mgnify:FL=1